MTNPIQGIVRGEIVVSGDTSAGVEIVWYAMVGGWDAIEDTALVSDENSTIITAEGTPFVNGMIGKSIIFARNGSRTIIEVFSPIQIEIDSGVSLLEEDTFTIEEEDSPVSVTLDEDDTLAITDIHISQEVGSAYGVIEGAGDAGLRITGGTIPNEGNISMTFKTPHMCGAQAIIKYIGAASGLNTCFIHGYLT